ncbi:hypothetical protein [Devosia sediminis]|uniref:Uncharacterized protein n=1 Tax=Devosia sediminis TaxID=2798801 RepID=A0A934IXQ4_9HYPH|nr:hypothetical protein [Devosia sediminis]MBJ3784960.1 hypothetical protein [Devosia sediminis]
MTKFQLAASVAALSLSLAAPAFAQSYTLNGTDVPEDQVANIQAHCDALFAAEPVDDSASDDSTSDDSDPGFSDEDSAESETPVDFATLDLTTVDIEACRAGGFVVSAEGGATDATSPAETSPQGDDAGATVNAPTTTK